MMSMLTSKFSVLPTYLGNSLEVVLEGGKQFVQYESMWREAVSRDVTQLGPVCG